MSEFLGKHPSLRSILTTFRITPYVLDTFHPPDTVFAYSDGELLYARNPFERYLNGLGKIEKGTFKTIRHDLAPGVFDEESRFINENTIMNSVTMFPDMYVSQEILPYINFFGSEANKIVTFIVGQNGFNWVYGKDKPKELLSLQFQHSFGPVLLNKKALKEDDEKDKITFAVDVGEWKLKNELCIKLRAGVQFSGMYTNPDYYVIHQIKLQHYDPRAMRDDILPYIEFQINQPKVLA